MKRFDSIIMCLFVSILIVFSTTLALPTRNTELGKGSVTNTVDDCMWIPSRSELNSYNFAAKVIKAWLSVIEKESTAQAEKVIVKIQEHDECDNTVVHATSLRDELDTLRKKARIISITEEPVIIHEVY